MIRGWFALCAIPILLAFAACGCNAFAEAVGTDGGSPDAGVGLTFDSEPYVTQDQRKEFTITFAQPPPWADEQGGAHYVTKFQFRSVDDPSKRLDDIHEVHEYCRPEPCEDTRVVTATLQADHDADTEANRFLLIEVAFEKAGQPQQTFSGTGRFWVFPAETAQTSDGGDGSAGDDAGGGGDAGGDR